MNSRDNFPSQLHRAGALLAGVVALVAAATMAGWIFGVDPLVRVAPAYPAMSLNSAVGLMGAALGLYGVASRRQGFVVPGALLALLVGGATTIEYLANVSFGIDSLFFAGRVMTDAQVALPGRMPGASAFSLVLAGLALLSLRLPAFRTAGPVIAGTFGAIVATLAVTVLLSYLTGVLSSLRGGVIAALSVQGCVAFGALGLGLMLVTWRR
ncbi:MAG TPA: hypothetical protein VFU23_09180, partial [Gemmatimonadales bacterium]|nr:hypothetical protein [Gemmatimonadales bacterium]